MGEGEKIIWGFERVALGAFAGVAAIGSKYAGQDYHYHMRLLDMGDQTTKITNLWYGYEIMTPILVFLGALLAYAAKGETNRLKLLALAVAAPALITTWAGGASSEKKFALDFVSSAFADSNVQPTQPSPSIVDGLKLFFGIGKDDTLYHVVVGSYKTPDEASAKVNSVKEANPSLHVYIGGRAPGNAYYPVVVGDYVPFGAAKVLKDKLTQTPETSDAYISPGPR